MSLEKKSVTITTAADGTFTGYLRVEGVVRKMYLSLGTLDTPDIDISDNDSGELLLSVDGVSSSTCYYTKRLAVAFDGSELTNTANIYTEFCSTTLKIAISGGGAAKSGTLTVWTDR